MKNFQEILEAALSGDFIAHQIIRDNSFLLSKDEIKKIDTATQRIDQNANAMVLQGLLLEKGLGRRKCSHCAIVLYEKAIGLGNPVAMTYRASMYLKGLGSKINYPAAIVLYEKAIDWGFSYAMYTRAYMHEKGLGGPVNYLAAIELYDQAIVLKNADALNNRGLMHERGRGGPINNNAALIHYKEAMELGNPGGMSNLADLYKRGLIDPLSAAKLFRKSISSMLLTRRNFNIVVENCRQLRLKHADNGEVYYHCAMAVMPRKIMDFKYIVKHLSTDFLLFLARDDQLTLSDKMMYVEKFIEINPDIHQALENSEVRDLIEHYYLQKAELAMGKKEFDIAIHLFHQVPVLSNSRGRACYGIAHCIYQSALKRNYSLEEIIDMTKPSLVEGMKVKDEDCEDLLRHMIESTLYPEEKAESDKLPIQQLIQEYDKVQSKNANQKSDRLEETKNKIDVFVKQHRLDDMFYWSRQVKLGGGKEINYQGQQIKVPHRIAAMYEILNDNLSSPFLKLEYLAKAPLKNRYGFFEKVVALVVQDKVTRDCYKDAKNNLVK